MSDMPPKPRSSRSAAGVEPDYEVGYGRPPLASRFKPGQCGNPRGRPRKPRSLLEAIDRELDRSITVREGGREKRLTKLEVIARRVADDACRGDPRATRLLKDTVKLSSEADASSADLRPAVALPVDKTDRAIVTAFAALIRSGGNLPAEESVTSAPCAAGDGNTGADPDNLPAPIHH